MIDNFENIVYIIFGVLIALIFLKNLDKCNKMLLCFLRGEFHELRN